MKERTMTYTLEPLDAGHRQPAIDIFNHYVAHSFAAYPDQPVGPEVYDRWLTLCAGYPTAAARNEEGLVVGFAFLRPYHFANTLRSTAEVTYFIHPDHTRRGLGSRMLGELERGAAQLGVVNLIAGLSSLNLESHHFHLKQGFRQCGRLERVGVKFGRTFDILLFQKTISAWEETDDIADQMATDRRAKSRAVTRPLSAAGRPGW
jgi:L-amino acid N-acyltransferase YncA